MPTYLRLGEVEAETCKQLLRFSCNSVLELSAKVSGLQKVIGSGESRGGVPGDPPPLIFRQTEARNFFWRPHPSPLPPLSQGLDSALISLTPVGGKRIFSSDPPVSLTEKSSFSFFHQALNSLSILNQIFLLFFSGSWHHSSWYHLGSISSWTPSSHTTKGSWWSRQFFWWVLFFFS